MRQWPFSSCAFSSSFFGLFLCPHVSFVKCCTLWESIQERVPWFLLFVTMCVPHQLQDPLDHLSPIIRSQYSWQSINTYVCISWQYRISKWCICTLPGGGIYCIRTLPWGGMYWEIHPPRPQGFPEGGDFAPRGPRDCPRQCTAVYGIPPLGTVRIQYNS